MDEEKKHEKLIVGLADKIEVMGANGSAEVLAKFDTGARNNSIDHHLAGKVGVGPVVSSVTVSSASGHKSRPVVEVEIMVKGRRFKTKANLEDRSHMEYKVLIGRELIHSNFLIDVTKSHRGPRELSLKKKFSERVNMAPGEMNLRELDE